MYRQVLCATIDDESRFRELIEGWIEEGSVPAFPSFISEKKSKRKARKRKHDQEAKEAEEALREMGGDPSKFFRTMHGIWFYAYAYHMHMHMSGEGEDSLKAMIKARQQSREEKLGGFFDSLELKYCAKKPRTTGSSKTKKATKSESGASSSKSTRARKSKK
jgi:hypothetical protein